MDMIFWDDGVWLWDAMGCGGEGGRGMPRPYGVGANDWAVSRPWVVNFNKSSRCSINP